jgi:uncharacterized membrane protein YjjP (DUF1212 family)
VTSSHHHAAEATNPALSESLDALLSLGAAMLRAGNTAIRTRAWLALVARKMDFDAISLNLTFDNLTVFVRRRGEFATAMRDVGPPSFDAGRIAELEQFTRKMNRRDAPRDISAKLAAIASAPPRYSGILVGFAIAVASGGFAFLGGGGPLEVIAAGTSGGIGHHIRSLLSHYQLNHYAIAMFSAILASTIYVLTTLLIARAEPGFVAHPGGFIASVLFLVPGFPLVAGLFDLLQYQTVAAVGRLAYGGMTLLAVAFGISIVIALSNIDLSAQSPFELHYQAKLILRGLASFGGGCAFAILFNNSPRSILAVGLLAVCANGLRLLAIDVGTAPAPAAFFAALLVGLVAAIADRWFHVPPINTVVPPIIIMVPGSYAYQMIISVNHGEMLEALQASASCGFIVGALAVGLAAARLAARPPSAEQSI